MHGAVFLRAGSSSICFSFTSGSCFLTKSAYIALVTIRIFSVRITFWKRSNVCCKSERPVPKKSKNCFGI